MDTEVGIDMNGKSVRKVKVVVDNVKKNIVTYYPIVSIYCSFLK